MRPTPRDLMTWSFSAVIVSGRPASMVNSTSAGSMLKPLITAAISESSCSADSVVGVPPPTYTLSIAVPCCRASSAVKLISRRRLSKYLLISSSGATVDAKEQYSHLVGQNGIPMYSPALDEGSPSRTLSWYSMISLRRLILSAERRYLSERSTSMPDTDPASWSISYASFRGRTPVSVPHPGSMPVSSERSL